MFVEIIFVIGQEIKNPKMIEAFCYMHAIFLK